MLWASLAFGQLERITRQEAVSGLRTALEKGSHAAVAQLGRTDGFFGNPQVKIPLPDSLTRTEKMLRRVGMGRYADELVLTMNRAAEAAVPEARQLLVDSIRRSEEHTSELQSQSNLVCRLLLEKKKKQESQ